MHALNETVFSMDKLFSYIESSIVIMPLPLVRDEISSHTQTFAVKTTFAVLHMPLAEDMHIN